MNTDTTETLPSTKWKLPYGDKLLKVIRSFSLAEKVVFYFFLCVLCVSSIALLYQVNSSFLVEIPAYGGSLTEGVVGTPRFVNPLLAVSDADRDLTSLVYSGLLKVDETGSLIPDLASSYTVSDDGLIYTFILKDKIFFHDGTPITADDVVYTIEKAQDPTLKSPRRTNWEGVVAAKTDDKTVTFTLRQAYSPFIQNTTLGILPKHIWKNASDEEFAFSQFNAKAIGSGPYKIDGVTYTASGLPSEFHLVSFSKYSLGRPYIQKITIKSYQNETDELKAFKDGDVDSVNSISPKQVADIQKDDSAVLTTPLPRVFGVFFNQNVAPVLVNKEVRQALLLATDKQEIVNAVLGGYGMPINGPIPPLTAEVATTTFSDENIEAAKNLLISKGWKLNDNNIFEKKDKSVTTRLEFSLSTGDAPELKATAAILQKQWQKMGAQVDVKIFEISDLNQNIIRPRKYDALLFGEVIGRDLDLYPFWHSSGRLDPGLNIALYTNLKVDKILESIRNTTDKDAQATLYQNFNKEIANDIPALFTYSPYFIYVVPKTLHNVELPQLTHSGERFAGVEKWYIDTDKVWKIFAKNTTSIESNKTQN